MDYKEAAQKELSSVPDRLADSFTHFIVTLYFRIQEHPLTISCIKLNSHSYHVLYILDTSPDGQVPMTELVTRIRRTRQQLSKLISDLEDAGLVTRIHSRENRRQVYVALTEEGRKLTNEIFSCMSGAMKDYLKTLPPEKLSIIQDITENLHALSAQLSDFSVKEDT